MWSCRIEDIIDFIRKHTPSTKIVLVGLPQRAVYSQSKRKWEYPNLYTAPIEAINHILRKVGTNNDHVSYVACGDDLLRNGEVNFSQHIF